MRDILSLQTLSDEKHAGTKAVMVTVGTEEEEPFT